MDEERRRGIGARITALRERSPFTQQDMANALGVSLRRYQQLEAVGTTSHQRCEEVATIHAEWAARTDDWNHADADWIWDGREPRATPDLMAVGQPYTQLLRDALEELRAMRSLLKTEAAKNAQLRTELERLVKSLRRRANEG